MPIKRLLAALIFLASLGASAQIPPPTFNYLPQQASDPTCAALQYWLVPVTTNQWRVCFNGTITNLGGGGGTGTVTSVTFTGDGVVDSATPSTAVTTSGTVTATLLNQAANTAFGNFTGGSAAPSFTATTGTGSPVAATSPTLVTPALGTPSALVITNATGNCSTCTAGGLNGTQMSSLATGLVKNTTGTGVPSIAAASDIISLTGGCAFLNGCIEQMQAAGSSLFTGIGGGLSATGSCTVTIIAATSTVPSMLQCTGVTTVWSAGWVSTSSFAPFFASRQPLLKFMVGYNASADYTTNARIQLGFLAAGTSTATMIASDTPALTYAIIRSSTVAGDATYQCVTDTGSGTPNVVAISGATPTTTATAMSISFGASSVTCTVGANSATSNTKVPTGAMYNFFADSGTSSNATHLQLLGVSGISQNGTF